MFINVAESQFGNVWNASVLHMECERWRLLQDKVSATCGTVSISSAMILRSFVG